MMFYVVFEYIVFAPCLSPVGRCRTLNGVIFDMGV